MQCLPHALQSLPTAVGLRQTKNILLSFLLETFFNFFVPHRSTFVFGFFFFIFVVYLCFEGQNSIWDGLSFAHVCLNLRLLVQE